MPDELIQLLWDTMKSINTLGHALQQTHMHLLSRGQHSAYLHEAVVLLEKHAQGVGGLLDHIDAIKSKETATS